MYLTIKRELEPKYNKIDNIIILKAIKYKLKEDLEGKFSSLEENGFEWKVTNFYFRGNTDKFSLVPKIRFHIENNGETRKLVYQINSDLQFYPLILLLFTPFFIDFPFFILILIISLIYFSIHILIFYLRHRAYLKETIESIWKYYSMQRQLLKRRR
jgi:hypothetical protein